ncbi:hypothetical protein DdX_13935 [Ditylenchus destructor]|uniref:Uncharacterized protein n=1 Tax=Ditylenchus destructor TaxID=166010 RepID=A0AAD4MTQ1_9BILA|nr:hypothetical protein DdX_13935 [Ditylenchus destructor]
MALNKVNFVLFLISLAGIFTSVKAGMRVKACIFGDCSVKFYDDNLNYVGGYSDEDLINYASSRRSGGYGSSGYGYYYPSYNYNNGYYNYYGNGYGSYYGNGYSNSGSGYSNSYYPYNYGSYYMVEAGSDTWTVHITGRHDKSITTLGATATGKEIRDAVKSLFETNDEKADVITVKKGPDANAESIMPNDKSHNRTELFVGMKDYLIKVYDTRKDSKGKAQKNHLGDVSLPRLATGKYIFAKVKAHPKYSWAMHVGAFFPGMEDALKNMVHIAENQNYEEEIFTEGVELYAS